MGRSFTLATTPFSLSISGGPQETFNGTVYGQGASYSFSQQLANGTGTGNAQLGVLNGQLQLTALPNPTTAPTLGTATTGGTIPAGTYMLAYSWANASGDTTPSATAQQITTGTTSTITVTAPALPSGATGINVYLTAGGTPGKVGTSATNSVTLTAMSPTGSVPTLSTATIAGQLDLTNISSPGRNYDFSGTDHGNGAGGAGGVKIFWIENTDTTTGQIITFTMPTNAWTNGLGAGAPPSLGAAPEGRGFFSSVGKVVAANNRLITCQALYGTPLLNFVVAGEASWL